MLLEIGLCYSVVSILLEESYWDMSGANMSFKDMAKVFTLIFLSLWNTSSKHCHMLLSSNSFKLAPFCTSNIVLKFRNKGVIIERKDITITSKGPERKREEGGGGCSWAHFFIFQSLTLFWLKLSKILFWENFHIAWSQSLKLTAFGHTRWDASVHG